MGLRSYLRQQEEQEAAKKQARKSGRGLRSAEQIRAADKGKAHLLKHVLLGAVKSGWDELGLLGISLKIVI